ncbi:MAG: response regulator [Chlorobi bacterium]|nr:response regulator [Chlorobiota bacterium]
MEKKKVKINILVVEDDQGLNKLLCTHIITLGYQATSAYNGKEALNLLREKPWDLMLLDYKLTDITADLLIEEVKKITKIPPFIIITGFGDERIAVKMMKKGARDYWVKEGAFIDTVPDRIERAVNEIRNLHKLRKARQKIEIVEQQSRKVLEAMADPVIVVNTDKKIVFHNDAFRETFGPFKRQAPCHTIIYNRKTPCPWCQEVSAENNTFININKLVERNRRFFQPAIGPIKLNGGKEYTITMFRDISDSVIARRKAEKNETILRNLIATARDAIIGINNTGHIVLHNRASLEMFEITADELQSRLFFDLLEKDKYMFRLHRLFRQIISGEKNQLIKKSFRLTIQTKSGWEKYIDTSLSVNEINGEKLYLFILRDISEQHKAELDLLEQKMLIRSLIDNLPDHIYFKDTQLRFLLSNKAHNDHIGVASEEELIGKTDMDLYPENLAKEYTKNEKQVIRSGRPKLNIKEKTINNQGSIRWLLTSKIPVLDGYGKVKGIIGIGRDITDLELNQQELHKSRRRLEGLLEISLMEHLDTATILNMALEKSIDLTDSDIGYVYFYNEATRTFTLHNWSESVKEQCRVEKIRTEFQLEKTGIWGEAVRQRRPVLINDYSQDDPLKKGLPKGHVPIRRFLTIPVFYLDKIVAVAGVGNKEQPYDQTDLIQLELLMDTVWKLITQKEQRQELIRAKVKAEESEKLKTVFMSTMSHELRTPLNAILGFSRLLESSHNMDEINQFAHYITESGERLLTIIENIFYVSAIDGQHLNIEEENTEPRKLVMDIIDQFKQKGIPENIKIETLLPKDDKITVIKTDVRKTGHILRSLVDNALKFTPSGNITAGYRLEANKIRFFVKDTGIGIPEDKREIIFEKFRQLDERTTREYGGIGIGLYLAKRLTEILKGKIWVEENKPQGSIFYVEIPFTILSQTKKSQMRGGNRSPRKSDLQKTVLIAEDNPVSALLLKKVINDIGLQPIHVENGLEAVTHVKENKPCDLILMDLNMPVMDGFQAIERIKEIRDDIPIIIQTAYDSETGRAKARELNVQDFISKPVSREQLIKKINLYAYGPGIMI